MRVLALFHGRAMKHGNLIYEPKKGHPLVECALDCLMLAREKNEPVGFTFNEVELTVTPTTNVDEILASWRREQESLRTLDEIEAKLLGGSR